MNTATSSMSNIEIHPVSGNIGAEITGVDLSQPLDTAAFDAIHQAFMDHLVIFFRDQDITPEQHVAFGRQFGELHLHPYIPSLEGFPEVLNLESSDDGPGEMSYQSNVWHTDLTFTQEPTLASILRGVKIPEAGGDTMFLNLYIALESLSPSMQAFLADKIAVHNIVATMPPDFMEQDWAPKQLERLHQTTPAVEHPMVRTHPVTKRKCLFVNRHFTSHIKDLSRAESEAILNFLYNHIEQPEFQVRFHWEKNSIAMWDNRCTQHYAVNDYRSKRIMHRVTVCGDRPF